MKTNTFQYILLAIFGTIGVAGIIYFSVSDPEQSEEVKGATGNVTVWGTYPVTPDLERLFADFNQEYLNAFSVTYTWHDPKNFDQDIVEALASGRGPDILLLPDDLLLRHSDKIIPIPYTSGFTEREYRNAFIQASEIYLRKQGMLALPFVVDPMVMYWNRDLFNNVSLSLPPKYWDEFLSITPKLTTRDKSLKVTQSAIAFGEYRNVTNAKDILAMLFLQSGTPIVRLNNELPFPALYGAFSDTGDVKNGSESALRFFMDFSNPQKPIYTWSLSRARSEEEFINGNLAVYFDFASRYQELKQKNPHLNFDVAMVPQLRDTKAEITIGRLHGLAAMKSSKNLGTAYVAIQRLLDQKYEERFSKVFNLPPVRRDLLTVRPSDAAQALFYDSALRVRTWLDPKPDESDKAFQTMVESVSSGKESVGSALGGAQSRLGTLLAPYNGLTY